jgi:hypothetical protein
LNAARVGGETRPNTVGGFDDFDVPPSEAENFSPAQPAQPGKAFGTICTQKVQFGSAAGIVSTKQPDAVRDVPVDMATQHGLGRSRLCAQAALQAGQSELGNDVGGGAVSAVRIPIKDALGIAVEGKVGAEPS